MNKIFLLLFVISNLCFSQKEEFNFRIPRFKDSPKNMNVNLKRLDLKQRVHKHIAQNVNKDFIKTYFKENDIIEFKMDFVIEANGGIDSNKVNIYTNSEIFNNQIKSVILMLPQFIPAVGTINKRPFPFTLNFSPEFYVNPFNELVPIFRDDLPSTRLNLYKEDIKAELEQNNIKKTNGYYKSISALAYFSTSENKSIENIRVFSDYNFTTNEVLKHIKSFSRDSTLYPLENLRENKNYTLPVYVYIQDSKKHSLKGANQKFKKPDQVAIYPGCEKKKTNQEKTACMSKKISQFISHEFNMHSIEKLGLSGRQRMNVIFKINTKGKIVDIRSRAPHPALEKEAERIIALLPKMIAPAKLKEKPVVVPYSLPIIFEITEGNNKRTKPFEIFFRDGELNIKNNY
ncbi:hypothetical protein GCM10023311_18510 [Flaviramulus aquimarinus]|uniref:TonB protein C-terminal n=1 Tax=Flaviramulus aquimarinus TaxID=1170456 RepID=A0ABP9F839_9FLAO